MKELNVVQLKEVNGGAISSGSRPVICGPIEIPKSNQTY
jgi:hypothetical protein